MCCFTFDSRKHPGMALRVSGTQIFARGLPDGRQFLVYSMHYASPVELAMVLPLPTPPRSAEDAVAFIDLSGYPDFFESLAGGFPRHPDSEGMTLSARSRTLEVHSVGSFEASFVPTQKDFARLDERFRLPEGAFERLPQYRDYGFAVFKLKQGRQEVHPMAFSFPRRKPDELFFPTVHVHDGTVAEQAAFDHVLYCQGARAALEGWQASHKWSRASWQELSAAAREAKLKELRLMGYSEEQALDEAKLLGAYQSMPSPARRFVDCGRAKGIVAPEETVARHMLRGLRANADTLVPVN